MAATRKSGSKGAAKKGAAKPSAAKKTAAKKTAAKTTSGRSGSAASKKSARSRTPGAKTASAKKSASNAAGRSSASARGSAKSASIRGGAKSAGTKRASSSRGGSSKSVTTFDHDEIRQWVESQGGWPAAVRSTEGAEDPGLLRIEFSEASSDSLEQIEWEEFFEKFDEKGLALVYQPTTRFNKLVARPAGKSRKAGSR
jgi:hypothetical protein